MADIVDAATRSRMMAGIRGKDTKPELTVRRILHAAGLRFRLHRRDLPGHPDLVLPRYRAAVFVHGCFWHNHDCYLFKWPSSRPDFWREKLTKNRQRDAAAVVALHESGWRTLVIWECALKSRPFKADPRMLRNEIVEWLNGSSWHADIASIVSIHASPELVRSP